MSRFNARTMLSVMISVICVSVPLSAGQKFNMGEFSADYVMKTADQSIPGKIFIKNDRMRMESTIEGKTSVMILRLDKGVSWNLMEGKKYMEMASVDTRNLPQMETTRDTTMVVKQLGKETVSGYSCDVTQYTLKKDPSIVTVQWLSPKLRYQVKVESKQNGKVNFTQTLSNIKEGAVSDKQFEIPPGYEKFDPMGGMQNMQEMMKQMMKQQGGDADEEE